MKKSDTTYNESFYSNQRSGSLSSANEVVPIILSWFPETKSVIDFGCGIGTWLSVFNKHGIKDILGIDGDYVPKNEILIPQSSFQPKDLRQPVKIDKKFDLAISLEVAEHLPENCSDTFVNSITSTSDIIIFSAAIPGQGGDDHINEQWQSYWIDKFSKKGYILLNTLREQIWNNEKIDFWYSQNINIFIHESIKQNHKELLEKNLNSEILNLVHPKQLELILQTPPDPEKLYLSQTAKLLTKVFLNSIKKRLSQ